VTVAWELPTLDCRRPGFGEALALTSTIDA